MFEPLSPLSVRRIYSLSFLSMIMFNNSAWGFQQIYLYLEICHISNLFFCCRAIHIQNSTLHKNIYVLLERLKVCNFYISNCSISQKFLLQESNRWVTEMNILLSSLFELNFSMSHSSYSSAAYLELHTFVSSVKIFTF